MYSTAVDHDGHKLGYIRLVNFGQHAALDMQHAVQKLQACAYTACSLTTIIALLLIPSMLSIAFIVRG